MVLTTFVKGLSDKTLQRTVESETQLTDDALMLNAFLEIENGNSTVTQSDNRVAQSPSNETLKEIVRLMSECLKISLLQSSQVQTGYNSNKNVKWPRSLSNDFRSSTPSVKFQSPQQRGRMKFRKSDNHNRRDNSSSSQRKKGNEYDSSRSACKLCKLGKNNSKEGKVCFNCLKSGLFRRDCKSKKKFLKLVPPRPRVAT